MSTEIKTAPVKIQCISLKADRTQCIRNISDGSQFCWQHAKSENKYGTILTPAPVKEKSNRGRPKGSKNKKDVDIVSNVAPVANSAPILNISNENLSISTVVLDSAPNPPNAIVNLNLELLKNLNWKITGEPIKNDTSVANNAFELQFDIGAETHISIPKILKFEHKNYTITEIHSQIIQFFKTIATADDLDKLIEICEEVGNDDLSQQYTDMSEEDNITYEDLQFGLDCIQNIVLRDSKYVVIIGDSA